MECLMIKLRTQHNQWEWWAMGNELSRRRSLWTMFKDNNSGYEAHYLLSQYSHLQSLGSCRELALWETVDLLCQSMRKIELCPRHLQLLPKIRFNLPYICSANYFVVFPWRMHTKKQNWWDWIICTTFLFQNIIQGGKAFVAQNQLLGVILKGSR